MPDLIADIRRRVAEMRREADELERALATIVGLVGIEPGPGLPADSPDWPGRSLRGKPLLIATAIRRAGGQLRIAKIVEAIKAGSATLYANDASAAATATGAMRCHPEVFRRVGYGCWALAQAAADPS